MYFGLRAWCTRWCDGVLNTRSTQPSLPTACVCTKNWNARLIATTATTWVGSKPSHASGSQNTHMPDSG